ncbi:response regulator [Fulvivirgaceae bacterium BMA10]|uniref:Response regulator n=1 Tax=Splendidivirga corallicola TaxID=3051826 RepID=A0ABT8KU73_9BACT|nr:response regulator [Fulvivirgaceae bacterium BMA10]
MHTFPAPSRTRYQLRQLRKQGLKIPIIALTVSVMPDVGDKVFSSGMNDYITKQFDPDDLYSKIKLHIEKEID